MKNRCSFERNNRDREKIAKKVPGKRASKKQRSISRDPPKNVRETKRDEPKKRKLERENSEANQWRAERMQNLEDNLITISSVKANQSVKRPGSATGKQTV